MTVLLVCGLLSSKRWPFQSDFYIKFTSLPPGVDRSEVGLAQINLQCLAYVQHWACAFKATKARAGKKRKGKKEKTSFPGLSAWLHHQRYEILKNICLFLPRGKSACPLWCALKSVRIGRCHPPPCLTETCLCPDIAHLCTPQRPASLQPSVLTHYRSSWQHHKWQNSVHYIPPVL